MTVKQLAAQIPAEYRREILLTNMIGMAVPSQHSKQNKDPMYFLFTYWKVYINPDEKADCNLCYTRILNNYKSMLPVLIELEKEANILKEV